MQPLLRLAPAGLCIVALVGCGGKPPDVISHPPGSPPSVVRMESDSPKARLDPRRLTHVLTTSGELVSHQWGTSTVERTPLRAGTKVGIALQGGSEAHVTTQDGASGTLPAAILREVWRVEQSADVAAVSQANNQFACDLYRQLRGGEGNLFFSPLSIHAALTMTSAGASGQNEAEMARTLHLTLSQEKLHAAYAQLQQGLEHDERVSGFSLVVANRLWGKQGYRFQRPFLATTRTHYRAELVSVDFQRPEESAATINAWVEQQTHGKIKGLVSPAVIEPLTRLILTNAVYFQADWTEPFKLERTRPGPFYLPSGKTTEVPLMRKWDGFPYRHAEGFKVLEMPYGQGQLAMLLLLPDEHDGLASLEEQLTAENLARWRSEMRKEESLEVVLPRFTIESSFSLKDALVMLGMRRAFDPHPDNFLGITDETPQWLAAVLHKAYVDVNEQGTEAAAATAVVAMAGSAAHEPPKFIADHPFVFLIRDALSGAILFCGRVVDPR